MPAESPASSRRACMHTCRYTYYIHACLRKLLLHIGGAKHDELIEGAAHRPHTLLRVRQHLHACMHACAHTCVHMCMRYARRYPDDKVMVGFVLSFTLLFCFPVAASISKACTHIMPQGRRLGPHTHLGGRDLKDEMVPALDPHVRCLGAMHVFFV